MTARFSTLIVLVASAFGIACESDRTTEPAQPRVELPKVEPPRLDAPVLTTLEISPSAVTLEQGWTVQLSVVSRDQRGGRMFSGGVTFSSSDPAIARVGNDGTVIGVAAGAVDISVSKTIAAVTLSAAMKATILRATPSDSLVLTADSEHGWQPSVAHLTAGGTVKWLTAAPLSWSGVPHRMLYLLDKGYAVTDSLDLSPGSATRKLLTPGEYRYCSAGCWDPPDHGIVYVH